MADSRINLRLKFDRQFAHNAVVIDERPVLSRAAFLPGGCLVVKTLVKSRELCRTDLFDHGVQIANQ